jgi:hypothetical protein
VLFQLWSPSTRSQLPAASMIPDIAD